MKVISGHNQVCVEICDALGLKHVRKLDIHMAWNEMVVITAVLYPEEDGMRKLVPILKKYHLLEVQEPNNVVETTAMGDDVRSFAFRQEVV